MERKLFYKNLKLFLKELVVVFPEDDDELQTIATSINLAIIDDDDNEILTQFYDSLVPIENEIINRDVSIFKKEPLWQKSTYEYNLFIKLNTKWESFSEHNKKIIWDYIQVLYTISKQVTLQLQN
jgi:hypothetical protein